MVAGPRAARRRVHRTRLTARLVPSRSALRHAAYVVQQRTVSFSGESIGVVIVTSNSS